MKNQITLGIALVAVVIAALAFQKDAVVQQVLGGNPGPVHTEFHEFLSGLSVGNVNATTTANNSETMSAGEIAFRDTLVLSQVRTSSAPATTTYTIAASSTLSHWLPAVGQRQTQCWISGTSTPANPGFIIAAGAGIDLETASTTATGLTVNGGSGLCINWVRDQLTNLKGQVTIFRDAD